MDSEMYMCALGYHLNKMLELQGIRNGKLAVIDADGLLAKHLTQMGYTVVSADTLIDTAINDIQGLVVYTETASRFEDIVLAAQQICHRNKCPLFLSVRNSAYMKMCNSDEGITLADLNNCMYQHCFRQENENDFYISATAKKEENNGKLTAPGTLESAYMQWLHIQLREPAEPHSFIRVYTAHSEHSYLLDDTDKMEAPFLTVVTRTQGKRTAELREVLLCLEAQTDNDFEILLVGHKVLPQDQKKIFQLVDSFPSQLKNKVRYIKLDKGNRSAPLNEGFRQARGSYITILDDDDLVFDNWVEVFHDLLEENKGKIFHSYCVAQKWARTESAQGLYAVSGIDTKYCEPFDYIFQLQENRCPTMGLAFPAELCKQMDPCFDETLDTTEDWDFLMRIAFIAGVADAETVTGLYRLWENASSSGTEHSQSLWKDNHNLITHRINSHPILLPEGSAAKLTKLYDDSKLLQEQSAYYPKSMAQLFWKTDGNYTHNASVQAKNENEFPQFRYVYNQLEKMNISGPCRLRFDLVEVGSVQVRNFCAVLYSVNGEKTVVPQESCSCNGCKKEGKMIFLQPDPQIYIPIPKAFLLQEIQIEGVLDDSVDAECVEWFQNEAVLRANLILQAPDRSDTLTQPIFIPEWNVGEYPAVQFVFSGLSVYQPDSEIVLEVLGRAGAIIVENFRVTIRSINDEILTIKQGGCGMFGLPYQNKFLLLSEHHKFPVAIPETFLLEELIFEAHFIRNLDQDIYEIRKTMREDPGLESVFFIDYGMGYNAKTMVKAPNQECWPKFKYTYPIDPGLGSVKGMRFDPVVDGGIAITTLQVQIIDATGIIHSVSGESLSINGFRWNKNFVFPGPDPQIHVLLPDGCVPAYVDIVGELCYPIPQKIEQESGLRGLRRNPAVLYPDYGNGHCAEDAILLAEYVPTGKFAYYVRFDSIRPLTGTLRFDPSEISNIELFDLVVTISCEDGTQLTYSLDQCTSNGYSTLRHIVFLKEDPQIFISLPKGRCITSLHLTGHINLAVSNSTFSALLTTPLYKRAWRRFVGVTKRLLGKR